MLIDTHTHFYDEWLLPDAEEAVRRAVEAGVGKMIQADIDSHERPSMWEIGNRHPGVIFEMLGLYPGSVAADWRDELEQVFDIAEGQARCSVPAEGVSLAQRHTSPGAAGVSKGAAPPSKVSPSARRLVRLPLKRSRGESACSKRETARAG